MSNLIVNFGGPRSLAEIEPFLVSLLTDRDVVWSGLPSLVHSLLFAWIAKKRAKTIEHDYKLIGGRSPIYDDTEKMAAEISSRMGSKVLTFHRYIPETHKASLDAIAKSAAGEIKVFPMFPQFSYATTGSIARFFQKNLPREVVRKLRWAKSYAAHPAYIAAMAETLRAFLESQNIADEEAVLLFSAHGVPQKFICMGDIYQSECLLSYEKIARAFPKAVCRLSYQSKFGRGEWLRPYTQDVCEEIGSWSEGRKKAVVVPLSFTSDHIETLFEVESQYLPILQQKGVEAYRCPALNHSESWVRAILEIFQETNLSANGMLVRPDQKICCGRREKCLNSTLQLFRPTAEPIGPRTCDYRSH